MRRFLFLRSDNFEKDTFRQNGDGPTTIDEIRRVPKGFAYWRGKANSFQLLLLHVKIIIFRANSRVAKRSYCHTLTVLEIGNINSHRDKRK